MLVVRIRLLFLFASVDFSHSLLLFGGCVHSSAHLVCVRDHGIFLHGLDATRWTANACDIGLIQSEHKQKSGALLPEWRIYLLMRLLVALFQTIKYHRVTGKPDNFTSVA